MFVIQMKSGKESHLYGASIGELHREKILKQVGPVLEPGEAGEIVVLDFTGVESVTASYLKAALLWFVDAGTKAEDPLPAERLGSLIFPVVAHLTDEVRAELRELLQARDRCCIEARDFSAIGVISGILHGPLDPALEATVKVLSDYGAPVSAGELEKLGKDSRVRATGWNNRLAQLHRLKLVQRRQEYRQWMYRLVGLEVHRG